MNFALLGGYILAVVMLLITPGPVIALVTATAARQGARKAFATVIGTNAASLVLMGLAILMLTGILSFNPVNLYILAMLGSVFIGYSAVQSLLRWRQVTPPVSQKAGTGGLLNGFLIAIANPKDILFFVSFFPQFIAVSQDMTTSIVTLALVWLVLDFAILSFYILAIKRWLPAQQSQWLALLSAGFLLLVGVLGLLYNGRAVVDSLVR